MLKLSRMLFQGFALALKLPENTFTQYFTTPLSQLRLIHYFDKPKAQESDSGIGAHTDYEFFTLSLPIAQGLQVLNGANKWINVPLIEDSFVINEAEFAYSGKTQWHENTKAWFDAEQETLGRYLQKLS